MSFLTLVGLLSILLVCKVVLDMVAPEEKFVWGILHTVAIVVVWSEFYLPLSLIILGGNIAHYYHIWRNRNVRI